MIPTRASCSNRAKGAASSSARPTAPRSTGARSRSWSPPRRLGYLWHINRDRSDATDVELTFVDLGDGTTRLEIVHSGWERLGAQGPRMARGEHERVECARPELRRRRRCVSRADGSVSAGRSRSQPATERPVSPAPTRSAGRAASRGGRA